MRWLFVAAFVVLLAFGLTGPGGLDPATWPALVIIAAGGALLTWAGVRGVGWLYDQGVLRGSRRAR